MASYQSNAFIAHVQRRTDPAQHFEAPQDAVAAGVEMAAGAGVAHPSTGQDAHTSVTIDQPLDSVAGFFASETDALDAMRQLSTTLGLANSQLLLLRPNDGGSLWFAIRSRQWAGRPHHDTQSGMGDDELLLLLGVTLAALGGAMLLALDNAFLFLTLALLSVAATGAAWAARGSRPQHLVKFAAIVRHQLLAGHWGLLVHGVLWERQAASLALIRARSVNWCAVSVTLHRL